MYSAFLWQQVLVCWTGILTCAWSIKLVFLSMDNFKIGFYFDLSIWWELHVHMWVNGMTDINPPPKDIMYHWVFVPWSTEKWWGFLLIIFTASCYGLHLVFCGEFSMKLSFLYVYIFCFKTQNYELCGHISLIFIFIMNF